MKDIFETEKILPAVTLMDPLRALNTAKAIYAGGIGVMEITFRTSATIEAITAVRNDLPEMNIGAGTILNKEQLHQAQGAGAKFGLSPGFNPAIVKEAQAIDFPFIPGVATPSEIEAALELGCKILKLFPVAPFGGIDFLKTLLGPYRHTGVMFIPMGGVNMQNIISYLSLQNVISVGGSWLTSPALIEQGDYKQIELNARETSSFIANSK